MNSDYMINRWQEAVQKTRGVGFCDIAFDQQANLCVCVTFSNMTKLRKKFLLGNQSGWHNSLESLSGSMYSPYGAQPIYYYVHILAENNKMDSGMYSS